MEIVFGNETNSESLMITNMLADDHILDVSVGGSATS